ncbi:Hypothetical protein BSM4216_0407 [Bacillus smithii]|jgi:hypothetical protein|nr:Hypothetical protein BSM4216_0407 [Bacillus smithii]
MPIGLPERLTGGHTQIPLELVFPGEDEVN